MKAPKCKLCGLEHFSPVCPNIRGKKVKERVEAIEATATPAVKAKAAKKRKKAKRKPVSKSPTPSKDAP